MCGITGFLSPSSSLSAEQYTDIAGQMADRLQHRGPDDQGTWCDPRSGIAFGHRRLSILDLSEQGHQPMFSSCGGYVLIYNGEIYNCRQLRTMLEQAGRKFRGHSDTEVLCEAISCWGISETLPKLQGMFAFAVWDRAEKRLSLVRDRLGIKPLYYGKLGNSFLFGSELKALRAHPEFSGKIDLRAVALQLRHNYIPAPYSIFESIYKLPAGHRLDISCSDDGQLPDDIPKTQPWWTLESVINRGLNNPYQGTYAEAAIELERLLERAVSYRLLADVPVGAFLSGGIDSSLAVALIQANSSQAVKTFTIGFSEYLYDESPYARRISEHLGTEHTELCIMPAEAQNVIPHLPTLFDEPFSDMSQIPTYLVCKLARRDVTVSLSGDGGDELFGGYSRYSHYAKIWQKISRIPARNQVAKLMEFYAKHSPLNWKKAGLQHYQQVLQLSSAEQLYSHLHRHWRSEVILNDSVNDPSDSMGFGESIAGLTEPVLNWMALDTVTYLPEDILTKVDRASMAVSLEARVPLLDHQIVEFAWSLPASFRFESNSGKRILQSVLERYVPRNLFERPKIGFGIPIGDWLRGSLFDWAEHLLSIKMLDRYGLLKTDLVRQKWDEHLSGQTNWQYHLWDVLMLQAWLEANEDEISI